MTAEVLRCKCGGTVRLVRLNARTLALGHETNPKLASHPVTLAKPADDRSSAHARAPFEDIRRPTRVREDAPVTERRPRGRGPSPAGRASQSGVAPRPRLRPARSAGSLYIAGEGE